MLTHHTKTKGDIGVLKAKLDLLLKGYLICNPETEHAPFDIVIYKDNSFLRVQVKYRAKVKDTITFNSRTCWADKNGSHNRPYDKNQIDIICIYCPDDDRCYYLDMNSFKDSITLRFSATKNNQNKGVNFARDFMEIPRLHK